MDLRACAAALIFAIGLICLDGTPEQIATAAKACQVHHAPYKTADAPDGYLFDHSAVVYVMSTAGRFVTTLTQDTSAD